MNLTDAQRQELSLCDECMAAHCTICGHPPCPCCIDDCDDPHCLVSPETCTHEECQDVEGGCKFLEKTHTCIYPRCAKHKQFEVTVLDVQTQQQERLDTMWETLGGCFKGRLT